MIVLAHVRAAFAVSNGTYGSLRMTRELQEDGLAVGRRRIARLMRDNGLRARQKRRFKRTTDSLHPFPVAPNLLDQDFTAGDPNEKWGADISYVWTREASIDYQGELKKRGILISMSGKGNCFDNSMVETFFKTLKVELVWRTVFQSRAEASAAIGRYIDGFYNPIRRHSALDFVSPLSSRTP